MERTSQIHSLESQLHVAEDYPQHIVESCATRPPGVQSIPSFVLLEPGFQLALSSSASFRALILLIVRRHKDVPSVSRAAVASRCAKTVFPLVYHPQIPGLVQAGFKELVCDAGSRGPGRH